MKPTRNFRAGLVCAGLAALLAARMPSALGADVDSSAFTLSGFGTLGATHSNASNADFVHGFFEPNGAGTSRNWALGVDTKAGLQLDWRATENLSAVVQVVSQHRYNNTYEPQLEWANLKYQLTPDLDVRVGRTSTAPFMVSESRLVGYANLWIRPPQEVYGLIPITSKDGIDSTYRLHAGEVTNSTRVSYGQIFLRLPADGTVEAKRYFELSDTVEYGPFTLRGSYSSGRVTLRTTPLSAVVNGYTNFGAAVAPLGFTAAAAQAADVAARYRFEDAPISVLTFGASYDRDRWIVMSEWARFNGHSVLADSTAYYATVGYRMGPVTPYVTAARLKAEQRNDSGVTVPLPAPLAVTANTLNAGLNSLLGSARFAQSSASIGARWDFYRNAALKVQFDRIRLENGSSGRLGNVQPNFQFGGKVNVFSVAVDFVF